ncbi:hypothetical protein [Balneatrix alpica]|uniref:hypothetical protein n=1 Tax=Balneatrix alpica TaxID=75684 RepID=UPI002738640E|nr:hypothetical protein [Balneatrix alpica]
MKDLIKEQYHKLLEDFAELNLLKHVVDNAFRREFEVIAEYEKNNDPSKIVSLIAFGFDNPFSERLEKYDFREITVEKLKELTVLHKNTQYCWLVASAFEKFERFLKIVFKMFFLKEERYVRKMLHCFSRDYGLVKAGEEKNAFDVNLKVAVLLVEKLRHVIVHNQGIVEDLESFTEKVISDSGVNGDRNKHELFIKQFFIGNRILLLESPVKNDCGLQRHHDVYRHMASYLLSYAYLVSEVVVQPEESI